MDETDIIVGGLLSQIAAICEDVEFVVVGSGVVSDGMALAEVRQKLMDAVALVDAVGVITMERKGNCSS